VASSSSASRERIRVAVIGAAFSGSARVDALSGLRDAGWSAFSRRRQNGLAPRRNGCGSPLAASASFDDAYRVSRIVEPIVRSDRDRRWVDVADETGTSSDRRTISGGREASR
jgi:hypothetical protein